MEQAYRKLFWGVFALTFHINIGFLPILPVWLAWIIVGTAIGSMARITGIKEYKRAAMLTNVLIGGSILQTICGYVEEVNQFPYLWVLTAVLSIVEILMLYELLTAAVIYFWAVDNAEQTKERQYGMLFYLVLYGILMLVLSYSISTQQLLIGTYVTIGLIILRLVLLGYASGWRKECQNDFT